MADLRRGIVALATLVALLGCGPYEEPAPEPGADGAPATGEGGEGPPATTRAASQPPASPPEELPDTIREIIQQDASPPPRP
jgi:hypothetical protein